MRIRRSGPVVSAMLISTFILHGHLLAQVPYQRILRADREPGNWLTYGGSYRSQRYSQLSQINRDNVSQLKAAWVYQIRQAGIIETSPIVADSVMYMTEPPSTVTALDVRTGRPLWTYTPEIPKDVIVIGSPPVNRGVAILDDTVFAGNVNGHLTALDAKSGAVRWDVTVEDNKKGYYLTLAPLALDGKIIVGVSGAETGIRGFVDAYDPKTGSRLWRTFTVPAHGEAGSETWGQDSWKTGGGSTWLTGSFDPDLNLLYWGTGNPAPDWNGDERQGDNLYTCSVLALNPDNGKMKWYFQFTPHDVHDWDSTETPVLVDRTFKGETRKLMLHADRNAFFYVLDRTNGKFLLGKPFARQTWAKGLDDSGRPVLVPNQEPTGEGNVSYPSMWGATNWMSPSYDPETGHLFITFREFGDRYYKRHDEYKPGRVYMGGKTMPVEDQEWGGVKAINAETGNIDWEYKFYIGSLSAGVLATDGGVLFAASRDGNLAGLDKRTGKLLWHFQTGAPIDSSPMSYAVDGTQFVALSAGSVLYSFALPPTP